MRPRVLEALEASSSSAVALAWRFKSGNSRPRYQRRRPFFPLCAGRSSSLNAPQICTNCSGTGVLMCKRESAVWILSVARTFSRAVRLSDRPFLFLSFAPPRTACSGTGILPRGGYSPNKNPPIRTDRLVGSQWTAVSDTLGWRHFECRATQRMGGVVFALMAATCDASTEIWVAKVMEGACWSI